MRWSLKLYELDFVVENRPGSRIPHADALSRHVGAVKQGEPLNRETILEEQRRVEFCAKQEPGTWTGKRKFFLDQEGLIYRRRTHDDSS